MRFTGALAPDVALDFIEATTIFGDIPTRKLDALTVRPAPGKPVWLAHVELKRAPFGERTATVTLGEWLWPRRPRVERVEPIVAALAEAYIWLIRGERCGPHFRRLALDLGCCPVSACTPARRDHIAALKGATDRLAYLDDRPRCIVCHGAVGSWNAITFVHDSCRAATIVGTREVQNAK